MNLGRRDGSPVLNAHYFFWGPEFGQLTTVILAPQSFGASGLHRYLYSGPQNPHTDHNKRN